jgi:hypothetical protein
MTRREPHIHTAGLDKWQRPFECYQDQPDTAERVRRQVQSIPFGLPEKVLQTGPDTGGRWSRMLSSLRSVVPRLSVHAAAAPDGNTGRRSSKSTPGD